MVLHISLILICLFSLICFVILLIVSRWVLIGVIGWRLFVITIRLLLNSVTFKLLVIATHNWQLFLTHFYWRLLVICIHLLLLISCIHRLRLLIRNFLRSLLICAIHWSLLMCCIILRRFLGGSIGLHHSNRVVIVLKTHLFLIIFIIIGRFFK